MLTVKNIGNKRQIKTGLTYNSQKLLLYYYFCPVPSRFTPVSNANPPV